MPILVTGTTDLSRRLTHQTQQGFTLIEILVVVIIIGIMMTTLVALRGSGQESRYLQGQAQRIQMVIGLAQQQAIYTGLPLSMAFSDKGYEFSAWQLNQSAESLTSENDTAQKPPEGQWQKIEVDSLKPYEPERPLQFSLKLLNESPSPDKAKPLYIYPDGLTSAAEIRLALPDWPDKQIKMHTDGFSALAFELIEAKP